LSVVVSELKYCQSWTDGLHDSAAENEMITTTDGTHDSGTWAETDLRGAEGHQEEAGRLAGEDRLVEDDHLAATDLQFAADLHSAVAEGMACLFCLAVLHVCVCITCSMQSAILLTLDKEHR